MELQTIRKTIDCLPLLLFVIFPLTFFNIENPDFQIYLALMSFVSLTNLLKD
jgi:hypothetical protein